MKSIPLGSGFITLIVEMSFCYLIKKLGDLSKESGTANDSSCLVAIDIVIAVVASIFFDNSPILLVVVLKCLIGNIPLFSSSL